MHSADHEAAYASDDRMGENRTRQQQRGPTGTSRRDASAGKVTLLLVCIVQCAVERGTSNDVFTFLTYCDVTYIAVYCDVDLAWESYA